MVIVNITKFAGSALQYSVLVVRHLTILIVSAVRDLSGAKHHNSISCIRARYVVLHNAKTPWITISGILGNPNKLIDLIFLSTHHYLLAIDC